MSAQRQKGTAFETAVVRYMNECGLVHVERRAGYGVNDRGDIAGVPGWVFECKNHKSIDLGAFMAELEREMRNAQCTDGVLVVKRRQRSVADAYCVVPLSLFVDMLKAYEDA